MAKLSKDIKVCMTKVGATPASLTVTAATQADPAVLTLSAQPANGDILVLANDSTGMVEIDGKGWVAANASAGGGVDAELLGSNTTNAKTFAAGSPVTHYDSTMMQCLCLSQFDIQAEQPNTIAVGTYCNPQDALSAPSGQAGTIAIAGYIDITDAGYQELIKAVKDNAAYWWRVEFPGNGYILVEASVDQIAWGIPLEGALSFTGTLTMRRSPEHLF